MSYIPSSQQKRGSPSSLSLSLSPFSLPDVACLLNVCGLDKLSSRALGENAARVERSEG